MEKESHKNNHRIPKWKKESYPPCCYCDYTRNEACLNGGPCEEYTQWNHWQLKRTGKLQKGTMFPKQDKFSKEVTFSPEEISALIEACNVADQHHPRPPYPSHGRSARDKLESAELEISQDKRKHKR